MLSTRSRGRRRRLWVGALLVALSLAILGAVAGHAAMAPYTLLRPRFNDLSQYIRYHADFHDGHSHDGYGHGYHGIGGGHIHDFTGGAVAPPYPPPVVGLPQSAPGGFADDLAGAYRELSAPIPLLEHQYAVPGFWDSPSASADATVIVVVAP
ncbi:MAG: hypothetical protein HY683_04595 [Chloroflexi bacterium]|nr:hypothetical protein [Chloroflexota bacterium]